MGSGLVRVARRHVLLFLLGKNVSIVFNGKLSGNDVKRLFVVVNPRRDKNSLAAAAVQETPGAQEILS